MNESDRLKVEIFQATFEHYYKMAMDHYTKAGTTSHILLLIVGAILVLIGYDKEVCRTAIDIISAILVMIIGAFGAVWAGRQMERYRYWECIAFEYQKKIKKIIPEFKTRHAYSTRGKARSSRAFPNFRRPITLGPIKFGPIKIGRFFMMCVQDRYLWVFLHLFIVFMGIALLVVALSRTCPLCQ